MGRICNTRGIFRKCVQSFTCSLKMFGRKVRQYIKIDLREVSCDFVHRCGASGSMRAFTQRARVRSPIGTGFLGEVFSGFFLSCKTNVRKLQAPKVPEFHSAVVIIIPYSPCWDDWVCAWCVLSFMFVLSRRWPRHWTDHSSGEALHVLVWSKKYVCDP